MIISNDVYAPIMNQVEINALISLPWGEKLVIKSEPSNTREGLYHDWKTSIEVTGGRKIEFSVSDATPEDLHHLLKKFIWISVERILTLNLVGEVLPDVYFGDRLVGKVSRASASEALAIDWNFVDVTLSLPKSMADNLPNALGDLYSFVKK